MPRRYWMPASMPEQLILVTNFKLKIGGYTARLGLTPAQVTFVLSLCDAIIGACNAAEAARASSLAMTAWREAVMTGDPVGTPVAPAPVFPVVGEVEYTCGSLTQFKRFRDIIVASAGYTLEIGEDLGIVGAEISPRPSGDLKPVFKSVTASGYTVTINGSMQGMDALRVEYATKGGAFQPVAFLTNTPAGFTITPTVPGQPEIGHVRAVFIKRSQEVGTYSADYPVTVA